MEFQSAIISPPSWTCVLPIGDIFDRAAPMEVDVGCGKGRFVVSRAETHPDTNFLGIDRLLGRMHKVDKKIVRRGLTNLRLLRIEAAYAIEYLLPAHSVSVFTVFFPDPWPKRRHHRRRLFQPGFLDALDRTLVAGGRIHVATDHLDYCSEIRGLFRSDDRFLEIEPFVPGEDERTEFETLFMQQQAPIGRCSVERVRTGGDRQPHTP